MIAIEVIAERVGGLVQSGHCNLVSQRVHRSIDSLVPVLLGLVERGEHDGQHHVHIIGYEAENILVVPVIKRSFRDLRGTDNSAIVHCCLRGVEWHAER